MGSDRIGSDRMGQSLLSSGWIEMGGPHLSGVLQEQNKFDDSRAAWVTQLVIVAAVVPHGFE